MTSMTALLDRVDYEDVTARAREVSFTQAVARLIAGILFLTGWAIAKTFALLWFAAVWAVLSFAEGWNAALADTKAARRARGG